VIAKGKNKMYGYSFMNYNCLMRRIAKGASTRDFWACYLSAGIFCVYSIDSVVCDYYGEPLVFLGYSHRYTLLGGRYE
jgi:hypothetical protein